jgi:hypothetical protein
VGDGKGGEIAMSDITFKRGISNLSHSDRNFN